MTPLDQVVDALAAWRLTRLIVDDRITTNLRAKIIAPAYNATTPGVTRIPDDAQATLTGLEPEFWDEVVDLDDDPPLIAYMIRCRWCTGLWVAAGVVFLRWAFPRAWGPVARVLAVAAVAGARDR